jgi:hypothetical protein
MTGGGGCDTADERTTVAQKSSDYCFHVCSIWDMNRCRNQGLRPDSKYHNLGRLQSLLRIELPVGRTPWNLSTSDGQGRDSGE